MCKKKRNKKDEKYGVLEIKANLPNTPYKEAAKALGDALLSGDFSVFESKLATNVEIIIYKKETLTGKTLVADYWKGWRCRYVETKKVKDFEVVYSNYYSNACLLIGIMVVMFLIRDNKIHKILLIQRRLNASIGYHDDILDFPFNLDSIEWCFSELRKSNKIFEPVVTENRIPCFSCGTHSEDLEWYSSLFQFGDIGYSGIVSVCPHCHKVVEYHPEMRLRYNEPVEPEIAKHPIPHRFKSADYSPEIYGLSYYEWNTPLKGTKYIEDLSGITKEAIENTNWFLLSMLSDYDLENARKAYMNAFNDGIPEAANILGVLFYSFGNKASDGAELIRRAVDAGSHHAMLNMFTVLWTEKKYQEAVDFLAEVYELSSPSLKCLWNKAYLHFMGEDYAHNPIKKKSPDTSKKMLREILCKDGDCQYDDEQDVFKNAKSFLAYIDEGNIFSSKAKDYHCHVKTNLDALTKKEDDSLFWSLDSLSIEKGYHICLHKAEENGGVDEPKYFVYGGDMEEDYDILKYIHVDETAMGAWQIYLLMTSSTVMPTIWQLGSIERVFILQIADLYEIEVLNTCDLSDLSQQDIYPSVAIERVSSGFIAYIRCCYWNEWEGLIQESIKVEIRNGMVSSYENQGKFVMYKYHWKHHGTWPPSDT